MKAWTFFVLLVCPILTFAQRIQYTEPEQEDSRRTSFEIIGRVGGNFLIFKNNRIQNDICVYDNDMKLIQRVSMDFLPERYINVDFIQYPDFCYMIYEYQKKNTVHCSAVKLDDMARRLGEPVDLDTTQISFTANNKIYTTLFSEDKQRIMVFKINSKNPKDYIFTTFLFDKQLELIDRHRLNLAMDDKNDVFNGFLLDNDGQLVFGKYYKSSGTGGDYVSRISLISKGPVADTFSVRDIGTSDRLLDEIKIKVDNRNKRYILTGFYYKQKKGNIEGVYTVLWDKETNSRIRETVTVFNDELRSLAKSSEANMKTAFNDFFIKSIIVEKSGGYLLVSESEYTTSRGVPFNRWDYLYGYNPMMSPIDYYSPYYNPYYPYNRYGYGASATRYNAENIMVLSFDKDGNLEWSNVIPKSQFDDESQNMISHHIMNTGGELHFLFNQYERRAQLLTDDGISPDGKLVHFPTFHNLDKGYDFMPRYAKQVSSTEILIPCLYRNYLCLAKIEF
ncbi:MAG TPA: hypothetical protein VMI35_08695 [Puia sp.]|nr:hypothetical protein [Puia sp.]